ncbi:hypothetical protein BRADI_1g42645v3 [Brachypodium distachyon]|uniref:Uncharacterized protein n=1 Tax=Brachypodium distachyon TaxID=15368 RepID=A0A2K2DNY6_BRADI|nr:hypothetical protein BRADI_1g42645v3 [Brachypodium distachyon]
MKEEVPGLRRFLAGRRGEGNASGTQARVPAASSRKRDESAGATNPGSGIACSITFRHVTSFLGTEQRRKELSLKNLAARKARRLARAHWAANEKEKPTIDLPTSLKEHRHCMTAGRHEIGDSFIMYSLRPILSDFLLHVSRRILIYRYIHI